MERSKLIGGTGLGIIVALGLGCGKPNPSMWEIKKDHNHNKVAVFSEYGKDILAYYGVPPELREMGVGLGKLPVDSANLDSLFSSNFSMLVKIASSPSFSGRGEEIARSLGVYDSLLYHRHILQPGLSQSPIRVVGLGTSALPDPMVFIINPALYTELEEKWGGVPPEIKELSIGFPREGIMLHHLMSEKDATDIGQILAIGRLGREYKTYEEVNDGRDTTNDVFGAYDQNYGQPDIVVFPKGLSPEIKYGTSRYSPLVVAKVLEKHGRLGVAALEIFAMHRIEPGCALKWVDYIIPNSNQEEKITKRDRCSGEEKIISRTLPPDSMFIVGLSEAIARGSNAEKALKFFKIARNDLSTVRKEVRDRIYQQLGYILPNLKSETEVRAVVQQLIKLNTNPNKKILEWLVPLAYYGRIGSLSDLTKLEKLSGINPGSCKSKLDELEDKVKEGKISIWGLAKRATMDDIVTLADSASKLDTTVLGAYTKLGENKGLNTSFSAQVLYVSSLVRSQTYPYPYNNIVEAIEANRDPSVAALLDTLKINKENVYNEFIQEYLSDPVYAVSLLFAKHYLGVKHFERYSDKAIRTIYPTLRGEYKRTCLIISADHDHNGVLERDKPIYDRMIDEGYGVLIVEAASAQELLSYLDKIREGVGKVDVIFINAHGSNDAFILGKPPSLLTRVLQTLGIIERKEDYIITKENSEGIETILSVVKPDGTIIFSSCHTGGKDGIAERIDQASKKKGMAIAIFAPPPALTGVDKIETDWSGRIVYVGYYSTGPTGRTPFYAPYLGRAKRTIDEIKRVFGTN